MQLVIPMQLAGNDLVTAGTHSDCNGGFNTETVISGVMNNVCKAEESIVVSTRGKGSRKSTAQCDRGGYTEGHARQSVQVDDWQ